MVHASGGAVARWPRPRRARHRPRAAAVVVALRPPSSPRSTPRAGTSPRLRRGPAVAPPRRRPLARPRAALVGPRAARCAGLGTARRRRRRRRHRPAPPHTAHRRRRRRRAGERLRARRRTDRTRRADSRGRQPHFRLSAGTRRRHTRRLLAALRRVARDGAPRAGRRRRRRRRRRWPAPSGRARRDDAPRGLLLRRRRWPRVGRGAVAPSSSPPTRRGSRCRTGRARRRRGAAHARRVRAAGCLAASPTRAARRCS